MELHDDTSGCRRIGPPGLEDLAEGFTHVAPKQCGLLLNECQAKAANSDAARSGVLYYSMKLGRKQGLKYSAASVDWYCCTDLPADMMLLAPRRSQPLLLFSEARSTMEVNALLKPQPTYTQCKQKSDCHSSDPFAFSRDKIYTCNFGRLPACVWHARFRDEGCCHLPLSHWMCPQ